MEVLSGVLLCHVLQMGVISQMPTTRIVSGIPTALLDTH